MVEELQAAGHDPWPLTPNGALALYRLLLARKNRERADAMEDALVMHRGKVAQAQKRAKDVRGALDKAEQLERVKKLAAKKRRVKGE